MQSQRHDGPAGSAAARNKPAHSKPVGSLVPQLVREACRRRGFNNIDIILRWREIVGPALAAQTWPLRIEWPRRQETVLRPDGTAEAGPQRTRLVVGSTPARALEVEYAKRDIVERVNRYLGYRAATELAAAPDYTVAPEPAGRAPGAVRSAPSPKTQAADDPLTAALARLGRGVAARGF
ncbi:MAG TPA: DciA family protein [Hyphomicrobiaceae bacterium]|jgi:hypothetical protein|nr:DciA family protein [Hyphomicrobiaceae bacterium]